MEWKNLGKALRRHGLTERECEISILSLQNLSVEEIAARKNLMVKTIKWYLNNSYRKMKASTHNEFFRLCDQAIRSVHESIVIESYERQHYLDNHLRDAGLTKGEIAVALLMAQGLSNREIAEKLFVAEKTIKFHSTRMYLKMKIKSRAQFIVRCFELVGMTWQNKLVSPNFLKPHEEVQLAPRLAPGELPAGIPTVQE